MRNDIMVYGLETCSICSILREELERNNIQYYYINISKNDKLGDKLEEIYKCTSYPMVLNKTTMLLPYTSLPNNPNIKIFNSIAELIQILKQ